MRREHDWNRPLCDTFWASRERVPVQLWWRRCGSSTQGRSAARSRERSRPAIWAAQQPLDKRLFRFPFDDVELLGKAVTRGRHWRAVGTAMHLANGAAFGAVYANLAVRGDLVPVWGRGPAAALAEHLASWPATALTERFHPARAELPVLARSRRAFAQATWRHVLFGAVLGALEQRLRWSDSSAA